MPKLSIDVQARTAQFQDGLEQVRKQSAGLVRDLDRGFSGLRTTFAALGGVAVLSSLFNSFRDVSKELDGLSKAAQGAGVTVEELSALRYAADFAGVGTEALDKSLANLGRRLEEAKDGTGEAVDAFQKLNIDPSQFDSSAVLIKTLADRFQQLPDGAQKSAIAMQLFGRSGAQLVPLLNSGSEGIEKMREEAEALGLVIDSKTAQAAERFNDNLARIGKVAGALQVYIAGPLITTLADLSDGFRNAQDSGKGFFESLGALFSATDLQRAAAEGIRVQETIRDIQAALAETDSPQRRRKLLGDLESEQSRLAEIDKVVQRLKSEVNETFKPRQLPKPFSLADDTSSAAGQSGARANALAEENELLAKLKERLIATQDLNEVQRVGIALASRNFRTEGAQAAIRLAGQIDAQQRLNIELQAQADLNDLIARAEAGAAAELEGVAERARNLADPFRQTAIEIEKIQVAAREGLIPDEVANKAINSLKKVEDQAKNVKETLERSDEISKEFWLSFQSGAEDAIFEGEKLSDVLKSLAEDIARLALRQSIGNLVNKFTNPEQAADKGSQPPSSVTNGATAGANNVIKAKAVPAGGGGITVNNYNTVHGSGGVTRGDLAIASKQTEKSTLAAIADQQKRGM